MMPKFVIAFVVFALSFPAVRAQVYAPTESDGRPIFQTHPVVIVGKAPTAAERRAARRKHQKAMKGYHKLRKYIRRVYPMAKACARLTDQLNREIAALDKRRDVRAYVKRRENELFGDYESTIRKMSRTEGRLLLKLIFRETGNSAFSYIKKYKSGASATFWQIMAKLYGMSLKQGYDRAAPKNSAIEHVIAEIERNDNRDSYQVQVHR